MARSRIKVPKRVVGVKIPKAVRKGPVMDFVNSKAGRILLAQALTAAIGVIAYKQAGEDTRERVGNKVKNGADEAKEALKRNTARLSFALGEAVTAFRTALGQPSGEPDADSAAKALANQLEQVKERVGKKKKPQSSSPSEPASHH
jgi:sRNA-binding protein